MEAKVVEVRVAYVFNCVSAVVWFVWFLRISSFVSWVLECIWVRESLRDGFVFFCDSNVVFSYFILFF